MAARNVKSFSAKKDKVEPIVFELEGETFEAYGQVPGTVLLEFIEASTREDAGGTAGAILGYLKASMNAENYKKFDKLTRDPEVLIELSTLSDIVTYLVEQRASDRPTE